MPHCRTLATTNDYWPITTEFSSFEQTLDNTRQHKA